ncbi:MAG TPA: PqqD family protein [Candidatus Binatia bacterium]
MLSVRQHVRPNTEEVAAKVMDGEAILINLSNGIYYSMDKVGAVVWELVEKNFSPEEMVAFITNRYDVESERARTDVERLLKELVDEKLILQVDGVADGDREQPRQEDAKAPYDEPRLNIYRDMGDLLALDPPTPGLEATPWKEPGGEKKD